MLHHISILRALAVFLVLLFHFNKNLFISGYIGVDIFFVISGYLIAFIVLKRVGDKKSLKDFYIKRIMRIFPALLFVSFVTIIFLSVIGLLEIETLQMFRDSMIFNANVKAEQINLDYFGTNSNNYLLHLWSISIELQFYFIFPLLILNKKVKLHLKLIIGIIIILSLILLSMKLGYYNSFGRMLAFTAGIYAYLISHKVKKNNFIYFLSLIGLFILSFFNLDVLTYPNYYNIIVVALGVLALLFGKLNNTKQYKPFIFIGLISYSIYLWHYPLFLLFHTLNFEETFLNILSLILLLLFLSLFSYTYIEKKFRLKNYGNYTILILLVPLVYLLSAVFYVRNESINIPLLNTLYKKITLSPLLYQSDLATRTVSAKYEGCLNNKGELLQECSTTKINERTKKALVIGNSFVHSGGLVFLDQVTAHYNIKSDFYYLFGDKIKTNPLYKSIKDGNYDYLIIYFPWLSVTKENLLKEYKEISKYTQIIFVKGTKYDYNIDKKKLFRSKNIFRDVNDSEAFQCITQKPYSAMKGYEVIDSVLDELHAKTINIYDVQKNNAGKYICSYNNIALYLDNFHINNYAGQLFAQRFIEQDFGKNIFTNNKTK